MSTLFAGSANGAGGAIRWQLRGPAYLTNPGLLVAALRLALPRALRAAAVGPLAAAQGAYSGTRFAGSFQLTTQIVPRAAVTLTNTNPLFCYVEYPTRPHTIAARNAPYLWFHGSRGWARVRSVQHPGTRGRLAIDPILARYEPAFRAALIAAVQGALANAAL